jgi:hypothetical protein
MASYPGNRRDLTEPPQPLFVVDLHRRLDLAVQRNEAAVTATRSYTGWEEDKAAASGWGTKIVQRGHSGKTMNIWYDDLDDDVCIVGDVEYREWMWDLGDDTSARECLNELDRVVDAFARDQLPGPTPAKAKMAPVLVLSALAAGAALVRHHRRPL